MVYVQDNLPKSRVTIYYITDIDGTPTPVVLPFRYLILGNFSNGGSTDRTLDLDERPVRNITGDNLTEVIESMQIQMPLSDVANVVDSSGPLPEFTIPITEIASFSPTNFMKYVPKLKGILTLKNLLVQVQAKYNNEKVFKQFLNNLYENPHVLNEFVSYMYDKVFGINSTDKHPEGLLTPNSSLRTTPPAPLASIPEDLQSVINALLTNLELSAMPSLTVLVKDDYTLTNVPSNLTYSSSALNSLASLVFNVPVASAPLPDESLFSLEGGNTYATDLDKGKYTQALHDALDPYFQDLNKHLPPGVSPYINPDIPGESDPSIVVVLTAGKKWWLQTEKGGGYILTLNDLQQLNVFANYTLFNRGGLQQTIDALDQIIYSQLDMVLHHQEFQEVEAAWTSLDQLLEVINWNDENNPVMLDIWDVTKDEIGKDLSANSLSPQYGSLFNRLYVEEYDQYGGKPYSAMVGLYNFKNVPSDVDPLSGWLSNISKIANASYTPFIGSMSYQFFGNSIQTADDFAAIKDLEGLLQGPQFSQWAALREQKESAFLGLTLPRYMVRTPYGPNNPALNLPSYEEDVYDLGYSLLFNIVGWSGALSDGDGGDNPPPLSKVSPALQQDFISSGYELSSNLTLETMKDKWFLIEDAKTTAYFLTIQDATHQNSVITIDNGDLDPDTYAVTKSAQDTPPMPVDLSKTPVALDPKDPQIPTLIREHIPSLSSKAIIFPQYTSDAITSWAIVDIDSYSKMYEIISSNNSTDTAQLQNVTLSVYDYANEVDVNVDNDKFLWGSSAMLFARNLARSFQNAGWAQYLRGPEGGGNITGLQPFTYILRNNEDNLLQKIPVEVLIPDYREWILSQNGFMPLLYKKGSQGVATFFSSQSVKKADSFIESYNTEQSQLVSNLSYTFSVCQIAHYIRSMMRDNIGTSADAPYIQQYISGWLSQYVTTVVNPSDLTLRFYPFKQISVSVAPREGTIGAYDADISIVPHIQFEEIKVDLLLVPSIATS